MIREHLVGTRIAGEKDFHWRGDEITRLEGFSDAVFAFAVALLVVSLEVPKAFHELMNAMRGFVAFAVCFALLAEVWSTHYRFFRRYGLQNPWVVFLNCVLLFFVLFYVYPLKFLFYGLFGGPLVLSAREARTLFMERDMRRYRWSSHCCTVKRGSIARYRSWTKLSSYGPAKAWSITLRWPLSDWFRFAWR